MSLQAELQAFRADFMARAPAAVTAAMTRADLALSTSGILDTALKAGDRVPDFALPDARGGMVQLSTALASGPVVLSFYRGGWCPYCNLELRALQKILPAIMDVGATLMAISPQTPDGSLSAAEKNGLAFPVLSDSGSRVAKSFGIAFELADELRPIYAQAGHALPERNGDNSWILPLPATYVIDCDGTVAFAYVDVDYRNRLDPAAIITTLSALTTERRYKAR